MSNEKRWFLQKKNKQINFKEKKKREHNHSLDSHGAKNVSPFPLFVLSTVTITSVFGLDTMAISYRYSLQGVLPKCELIAREELGTWL